MTVKAVVLGGNFAGLNAAIHLKHHLKDDIDVTVISASDEFLFNPSLIWLPFGKRTAADITFKLDPTFTEEGVHFVHAEATLISPEGKRVTAGGRDYDYDYLVIATGYRNDMSVIDGLVENSNTITTLPTAEKTGVAWQRFLDNPGPIVIGATQGAGCFGAAYEFLFNTAYQLKKAGLKKSVPLTYVTSEPFLGHFGINGMPGGESLLGMFMKKEKIATVVDTAMDHVDDGRVVLADGSELPFAFSMIVPPFLGQDVVINSGLGDAKGYVQVRDTYQTLTHDNIYAIGIAAAVPSPWTTATPIGIPKTGFPTEMMARVAAKNIVSAVKGEALEAHKEFKDMPAVCVMDAGNNGVMILGDKMLADKKKGILVPGPQNHLFKLGFEKYFLWKMKNGHVSLP